MNIIRRLIEALEKRYDIPLTDRTLIALREEIARNEYVAVDESNALSEQQLKEDMARAAGITVVTTGNLWRK